LTTPYREEFWTYYAHMDTIPANIQVGANVGYLADLGEVGSTGPGCVLPPGSDHLHFGVFRVRNVADALMDPPVFPHSHHGTEQRMIDPYGWNHPSMVDPWAFLAPPGYGAASINLWYPSYAPVDWGAH